MLRTMGRFAFLQLFVLFALVPAEAAAQDSTVTPDSSRAWYEDAWTTIVRRGGVQFDYVFYRKADNRNNGVVIRLKNRNEYPVRYAFTILFRGPEGKEQATTKGILRAGEMKTGEANGLFWIPFAEGRRVGEIGLRGIEITRIRPEDVRSSTAVKPPWRSRVQKTVEILVA